MKAKLKKAPAVIITVLVVLVLVFYISYQIYSAANPVYKTETAIITEVTDGINCSGMIFRDEVTIPIETDGVVEFTSEDGSKVAQGYTVAKVYSTKEAARKNAVGYLYSEKADLYEQIEQSADVASTNIESLSNELYDSLKQLSSAMDEHSGFSSAGNSAVSNLYMFKQAS
ncbi:MAG: HlyD family efflux transporter periplasmic adaptor subunit, partial [Oscillospiraceae bacterium]